ncbi:MAG TPA: DUF6519 domain-containing protein [Longimicrobium sp.]|nr:DUF6519 domain-containing protein [Longimicrobium sp.]
MKGDTTRHTFDAARHFSGVRMQQGRVQLDADWNEQADIARHRVETETRDAVGRCGGPLHDAAFRVVPLRGADAALLAELGALYPGLDPTVPDLVLLPGRYYVDGILCACDRPVPLGRQPDLPRPAGQAAGHGLPDGSHLLYLDVWERHLTALEAPAIREVALGGPDTATRTRTVWQVRSLPLGNAALEGCAEPAEYAAAVRPTTGRLRARARPQGPDAGPCVLPGGAGYQGMENQHYRVEVHAGGDPAAFAPGDAPVTALDPQARTVVVAGGAWPVGGWVELAATGPGSDPMAGVVAQVAASAGSGPFTLTLSGAFPAMDVAAEQPRLRAVGPLWKWSRDNGTVVARVMALDGAEVTLESLGRDDVLDFDPGHWVELYDDLAELNGRPGQLLQVESRDTAARLLTLRTPAAPLAAPQWLAPGRTPRLRRWDGIGALRPGPAGAYAALEDGVEVRFEPGTYRTGEYWLVPARTATAGGEGGGVEWPDEAPGVPAARRPLGIEHHHCRLAGVRVEGGQVTQVVDCRCLFAPATELNALAYVSGAGQEAPPDPLDPQFRPLLGLPLVVGVGNGHCHPGRRVRFQVLDGGGGLDRQPGGAFAAGPVDVDVGGDGLAACWWKLGGTAQHQRVSARLLEPVAGGWLPVHNTVLFNASLSVAGQVAYHPRDCGTLAGRKTVQDALDRVVDLVRLYPVGGHGQEAMPGAELPATLRVLVTGTCGPVAKRPAAVRFDVVSGGGTLTAGTTGPAATVLVPTDANGIAAVRWRLGGAQVPYQEVRATLRSVAGPAAEPAATVFGATVSMAAEVAYTPPADCAALAGATTVREALDKLCVRPGGGCSGFTVSPEGDWEARLRAHLAGTGEAHVCFRPGTYTLAEPLVVPGTTMVFSGAGPLSVIQCEKHERAIEFVGVDTVIVRGLAVEAGIHGDGPAQSGRNGALTFRECRSVTVEDCMLVCRPGPSRTASCLLATREPPPDGRRPAGEVVVRGCTLLVGDRQVGVLLVNPGRAAVDDNVVRAYGAPFALPAWLESADYLRGLGGILHELLAEPGGVSRSLGWRRIHQRLAAPDGPAGLRDQLAMISRVRTGQAATATRAVSRWVARLENIAAQGIVVGGTIAGDVRVRRNTLDDVVQGVHVGLSHAGPRGQVDAADNVEVSGNTISVRARHGQPATAHGIFVGNAYQVMVDENRIASTADLDVDDHAGIRLHGWYGPMVTLRENRMESTGLGIYFNALNPVSDEPLYWAGYNVGVDIVAWDGQEVVFVEGPWKQQVQQTLNRLVG